MAAGCLREHAAAPHLGLDGSGSTNPIRRPPASSNSCRCERSQRANAALIASASTENVCAGPTMKIRPGDASTAPQDPRVDQPEPAATSAPPRADTTRQVLRQLISEADGQRRRGPGGGPAGTGVAGRHGRGERVRLGAGHRVPGRIPFFQHFALVPNASPEVSLIPFTLAPAGMEVLNGARGQVGLPPLAGPAEAWRAPLYLYYTAEPFEDERLELPPSSRLVGPGLWEPPAQATRYAPSVHRAGADDVRRAGRRRAPPRAGSPLGRRATAPARRRRPQRRTAATRSATALTSSSGSRLASSCSVEGGGSRNRRSTV